jgi:hypothetical protein
MADFSFVSVFYFMREKIYDGSVLSANFGLICTVRIVIQNEINFKLWDE